MKTSTCSRFEAVTGGQKGVCFRSSGGERNGGQSGGVDTFSGFAGSYSRHLWSKGEILLTLLAPRSR